MKSKFKGFTLVELVAVIAIIGVLAAVTVPNMLYYARNSKTDTADSKAKVFYDAACTIVQKCQAREKAISDYDDITRNKVEFYMGNETLYFGRNIGGASFSDAARTNRFYDEMKNFCDNIDNCRWFVKITNYKVECVYYSDYDSDNASNYDVFVGSYPDEGSFATPRGEKTDGGIKHYFDSM